MRLGGLVDDRANGAGDGERTALGLGLQGDLADETAQDGHGVQGFCEVGYLAGVDIGEAVIRLVWDNLSRRGLGYAKRA